jgi:hypothetical protein
MVEDSKSLWPTGSGPQCDALTFLFEGGKESIPCTIVNIEKRDNYGFKHTKSKKDSRQEAST